MNHVYRTVTRCVGYAGILGCFLAGSAALAGSGVGTYLDSARTVRFNAMAGGSYIQTPSSTHVYVRATGKWTSFQDGVSRYKDLTVPVSKTTLRQGALAVLGRGVMHPGFQLALFAAGFIIGNDGEVLKPNPDGMPAEFYDIDTSLQYRAYAVGGMFESSAKSLAGDCPGTWGSQTSLPTFFTQEAEATAVSSGSNSIGTAYCYAEKSGSSSWRAVKLVPVISGNDVTSYVDESPQYLPIEASDWDTVDPYIEPGLADELWRGEPIPEWRDEISILGQPASQVDSGTRNQPPEVASAVGKWAENLSAQYNGDAQPHPDGETGGQSAADQQYDEAQQEADEPIPPFPDEEVNWQTEVLTLPSFSSGIGSGSCPGSQAISLPMGHSMTIEYTPACDLATMVRPALVGVCGIIALLIVLRARGGA